MITEHLQGKAGSGTDVWVDGPFPGTLWQESLLRFRIILYLQSESAVVISEPWREMQGQKTGISHMALFLFSPSVLCILYVTYNLDLSLNLSLLDVLDIHQVPWNMTPNKSLLANEQMLAHMAAITCHYHVYSFLPQTLQVTLCKFKLQTVYFTYLL